LFLQPPFSLGYGFSLLFFICKSVDKRKEVTDCLPASATMAPQQLVPQTENIADVYATDDASSLAVAPEIKARWQNLVKQFVQTYGKKPDFVARSPGRVNIIGEHIDYNLYDVLPTAVSVDVIIAVKVVPTEGSEATVKISNVNSQKFPSREFGVPFDTDVVIDPKKHEWINYFKAGLVGALKFLRNSNPSVKPVSLEIHLDGNVPPGGGISSSAAFVCASALAVIKANGIDVSKQDLLDLAVVSERAVGVYSGGFAIFLPLCSPCSFTN
jgi:galactokinase